MSLVANDNDERAKFGLLLDECALTDCQVIAED